MHRRSMMTTWCAASAAALLSPALCHAQEVEWRHYRPTNTGILGDYVQTLYVDENDRPWIAAYTPFWEEGGMSHMEPDGTWTVVSSFEDPGIGSPRFNDIVKDAAGDLWIGTYDGLLRYDPAAGPSSLHLYDDGNSPIPSGRVYDADFAPDGSLWLAVHDFGGPGGGLVRYTPGTDTWQAWDTTNGLPWGGQWRGWDNLGHVAVLPDASGPGYTVWFNSASNLGVGTYRDGTFTWLGSPQDPPPGRYPVRLPSADPVDDLGNIWILTNEGLVRRGRDGAEVLTGYPDGLSSEVSVIFALRNGRAVLGTYYADVYLWDKGWSSLGNWGSGNHTYTFAEDSQGNIWAGGIGGSAKYQDGVWQRYRLTNTGMLDFWIEAIDFDDDTGDVFMSANAGPNVGGFDILHPDETWTNANNATYGLGLPWGLPTDNVASIAVRENGRVALALSGAQGLVEWDGSAYTYLIPQGFGIEEVDEDGLGRLWAAHYANAGISRLDADGQETHYAYGNSPLPAGSVGFVEPDPDTAGFVWITTAFGIAHTDGDAWTIYPRELIGLNQNTTSHLLSSAAPAPNGTLWIGSYSGLYDFDLATSDYTRYTPANSSLPSEDVHLVHTAPDGSIWAGTFDDTYPYPGGLTHFDGQTWTTYSRENSPLPHNQIWALNSRVVPGGYELWVGTASEGIAVLTVPTAPPQCPPDWNGDGSLTSDDFFVFLSDFFAIPPSADFTGDGTVDSNDFFAFLEAFFAGC